MIKLNALFKSFGSTKVLRGVNLEVDSGEIVTLQLHEELSEGVKLVDVRANEAIFEKEDGTYMIINFKNQIKETDEY